MLKNFQAEADICVALPVPVECDGGHGNKHNF